MNKLISAIAALPIMTTILGVGLMSSAYAEKPNLNDGIICIAGKRGGFYYTTATIDDASISQKQPVSVTVLQKQGAIGVNDVVIYDRAKNSLTIADLESIREYTPAATPVGSGKLTYSGNNTFTGKTSTGAPINFTLSKDYSVITLTHNGQTYKGVCR